ncbi:hypothetical protein AN393_03873 [Pseudoalteromonas sp. P1-25]|nr:hypothetical protein AN393_03873 [Pseudoalteromonas sp. P1-25]
MENSTYELFHFLGELHNNHWNSPAQRPQHGQNWSAAEIFPVTALVIFTALSYPQFDNPNY